MSDHPRIADLAALLQALDDAGIEFIVVGGVAAVLHGAPIAVKSHAGRHKDRLVVPILIALPKESDEPQI